MRKLICMLMSVSILSGISHAAIVAFNAEDSDFYYQAGAQWTTVEDEAALNGAYITATIDVPPQNDENTRFYSFEMPAGTYSLFIRINMGVDNGSDDSLYISNNSLAETAGMVDFNGIGGADEIDGNPIAGAGNFGWVRARQSYSDPVVYRSYEMAADGTAYFKAGPRENGLNVDAFAFVPEADAELVTGAELDEAVLNSGIIRGAATDPVPASSEDPEVDSETMTSVSWTAPSDPNLISVTGYDVVFGTEPNMLQNAVYSVTTESLSLDGVNGPEPLDFDTTYYWRVDSHIVWDDAAVTGVVNDTIEGYLWTFTTLPDNKVPAVTAGSDVLTAMQFLPAGVTGTVNDYGEGDITSITWTASATAPAAAMQMITRNSVAAMANLGQITGDPNLLMDWIGTDTREVGNPMVLTLKGLPADTYSWTSYHHDPDATFTGVFDATVFDASGESVTADIQISDSNSLPIGTFTTSIAANGTNDVVLIFDQQPYAGQGFNDAWFVMNGFELTADTIGGSPLSIDFGLVNTAPMPGYEAYQASHEQPATFTEQSFSAFGTTVSILPTWGGYATLVDMTNDPSSSAQSAILETQWPGDYTVRLSATDSADQTGSDTLVVTVAANACAAAQLSSSWNGFNVADFNEDCVVNLEDFAGIAAEWLDDRNLDAQE